ncbi:hypothetical protein L1987_59604 [Smallanthus sonchifolius]|uniref:Uncharacterized protein n=1 Tax=Smallanthus sonchifolius TaxID=185202 RepID=A0ACB9D5Z7_9ASTR|nr:hypothetical protein L1987_59604 [Smallanthus sonchifolius]
MLFLTIVLVVLLKTIAKKQNKAVSYARTMNFRKFSNFAIKLQVGWCVELAKQSIGCTSPNPIVGYVIVKFREIVGEGSHPKAEQSHAKYGTISDSSRAGYRKADLDEKINEILAGPNIAMVS